ncbi:MAG: YlbF family regulator [Bacilli bacterium]
MTEEEKLLGEAKKLLSDFSSLPEAKRYFLLKKEAEEDPHLCALRKKEKDLKASLRFLAPEEKKKTIEEAKKVETEIREDPLAVNLDAARKDLSSLLAPLIESKL